MSTTGSAISVCEVHRNPIGPARHAAENGRKRTATGVAYLHA
jgi:hypothetical protein